MMRWVLPHTMLIIALGIETVGVLVLAGYVFWPRLGWRTDRSLRKVRRRLRTSHGPALKRYGMKLQISEASTIGEVLRQARDGMAKVETTREYGRALGLSDDAAREVMQAWLSYFNSMPSAPNFQDIQSAMERRVLGERWLP